MLPNWMKALALALTTAANTITASLQTLNNVADTTEAYTNVYKTKALQQLKAVQLNDLPDAEES